MKTHESQKKLFQKNQDETKIMRPLSFDQEFEMSSFNYYTSEEAQREYRIWDILQ